MSGPRKNVKYSNDRFQLSDFRLSQAGAVVSTNNLAHFLYVYFIPHGYKAGLLARDAAHICEGSVISYPIEKPMNKIGTRMTNVAVIHIDVIHWSFHVELTAVIVYLESHVNVCLKLSLLMTRRFSAKDIFDVIYFLE